jgi:hypothetical protein
MEMSGSGPCPRRFAPGERSPGTRWMDGSVSLRVNLDAVEKYEYPAPVSISRDSYCNMHACLRPLLSNGPSQQVNSGDAC